MTVRPILFSGPMVRAILDGRKTQTRRVLPQQPSDEHEFLAISTFGRDESLIFADADHPEHVFSREEVAPPPYFPGDLLWVRERWSGEHWLGDVTPSNRLLMPRGDRFVSLLPETWYWADGSPEDGDWEKPRPSIHMPRWASRLTLEVTEVRVQRVQEISCADAFKEGIPRTANSQTIDCDTPDPREAFRSLWDSLNAKRGFGWDANPWVAAISFKAHQLNIDAYLAEKEAA